MHTRLPFSHSPSLTLAHTRLGLRRRMRASLPLVPPRFARAHASACSTSQVPARMCAAWPSGSRWMSVRYLPNTPSRGKAPAHAQLLKQHAHICTHAHTCARGRGGRGETRWASPAVASPATAGAQADRLGRRGGGAKSLPIAQRNRDAAAAAVARHIERRSRKSTATRRRGRRRMAAWGGGGGGGN